MILGGAGRSARLCVIRGGGIDGQLAVVIVARTRTGLGPLYRVFGLRSEQ